MDNSLLNLTRWINYFDSSYNNKLEKAHAHNTNKYRDKEQPCFNPLWRCISLLVTPLIKNEEDYVKVHLIIKSIHFIKSPNLHCRGLGLGFLGIRFKRPIRWSDLFL